MKNIYKSLSISLMIGLLLSNFFSFLYANGHYHPLSPSSTMGTIYYHHFSEPIIMLISMSIWMLIGLLFSFNSLIFNATDWSITKSTFVHFICSYFPFTILAILAGWFPLKMMSLVSYTIIFIGIYILIWFISYLKTKKEIKNINEKLIKFNSNH